MKDIDEGQAGILSKFLMVQDLLEQRLLQRFSGAAPQLILPSAFSNHHTTESTLGRRSGARGMNFIVSMTKLMKN